jgi:large subunit ribosomal protein L19
MNKLHTFETSQNKFEGIQSGWIIKVFQKIKEGDKSRVQAFEGMVIGRKHGDTPEGTITVRKVTGGIGVEKIYPVHLPTIDKVEVVRKTNVKRSKLYYLRDKSAKEIRKKVKMQALQKAVKPQTETEVPAE